MLETIGKYIDIELATIILGSILLCILLNIIFKKISMPVIVHWLVVICAVGVIGFFSYNYLKKEEIGYVNSQTNNYIVGKVQFVGKSIDKINIKFISSNLYAKNVENIVVKVNSSTKFLVKEGYNPQKEITIDELKIDDIVTVYCKENSLKNDKVEITAKKIIKKGS